MAPWPSGQRDDEGPDQQVGALAVVLAQPRYLISPGTCSVQVVAHYGRLSGVHGQRTSVQVSSDVHGNILD
jgi:hypothetical protein